MSLAAHVLIDKSAINHNVAVVRQYAPDSKIMAVIKADAYGHGILTVAEVLSDVNGVAVARLNEAILLRQSGFINKIKVLEGFVTRRELQQLVKYELDVVVHSVEQLEVIEQSPVDKKISVWLKLDTGMSRLGISTNDFLSIYQRLLTCTYIKQPIAFMTHLSSADEINNLVTTRQIKLFDNLINSLKGQQSIANSAGIISWNNSIRDWVRPGIMLYGVSPFTNKSGKDFGLKPVMSLCSRLISVKNIDAGVAVGYSGTWVSEKKTKLGVVAIGYGDGYPRSVKNGTPVLVNGKLVPLVGRVSMDTLVVNLNSQPNAKAGDSVLLWGQGLPVEEIAHCADTIPYILLCGITSRVERKII